jgi:hypothetical protein
MSTTMWLTLVTVVVTFKVIALGFLICKLYQFGRRHLGARIAYEYASGNLGVRRRVQHTIGRKHDVLDTALRAETMPGYMWFYWTRRAGEGFRERHGWALTKKAARRRAAAAAEADQRARARARR